MKESSKVNKCEKDCDCYDCSASNQTPISDTIEEEELSGCEDCPHKVFTDKPKSENIEWEEEAKRLYFQQGISIDDWLSFVKSLLAEREAEMWQKIKNYDFKENHLCRFNDGKQNCECFIEGLNVTLLLLNNKK